jgi:tetratricopeptide (TPR) repeat protein
MVMAQAPDAARRGQAIALYEDLVNDLPTTNPIANTAREKLASLLLEAGRPERAVEEAVITARSSADSPTIALYIEALLRSKKYDEALRQLDRLATIRPGDPAEATLRVRWLRLSTAPAELAATLEKAALERHGGPGAEAFEREAFTALIALGPQALDRADRIARSAVSGRPAASWMRAQVLAARGDAAEALTLCQLSVNSSATEDLWGAAQVAVSVAIRNQSDPGLLARVDQMMDVIRKREPKHYGLAVLTAMLRHIQGRYEDEVRLYREALALSPGDPTATNNLAWILSEGMNRADEALGLIDALIARAGRKPDVLDTRGVILSRAGKYDAAIKDLEESVAAEPSPVAYFHLAVACRKAGLAEKSRKNLDLAVKAGLSPDQADRTERDEVASMLKP